MQIFQHQIKLDETDATQSIYFTSLQKIAVRCFEEYLFKQESRLESPLLPIVHVEASYLVFTKWRDEIEIRMSLDKKGQTSFSICYEFYRSEEKIASIKIVHVVVEKKSLKSTNLYPELLDILSRI